MDLKELSQEEELIDVALLFGEDGEPTDGFKVVSLNSAEYQECDRQWKVKNVRKSARRGRAIEASTETGARELVELVAKREFAICCACIKEIYGFTSGGSPAPLNEETLKAIFSKKPSWRTKVVNAIEAEQLFTKASPAPGAQ